MGYYSTATGEIIFSPELPRYAIKGNQVIYKYANGDESLTLDTEWSSITATEDQFKAYWLEENLFELVNAIMAINPETVFEGFIEVEGEGNGSGDVDLSRLRVKNGKVEEIRPQIVWPED